MEIAIYVFTALAVAAALVVAIFAMYAHWRGPALWTGCFSLCCLVIAGSCWFQDREWKRAASAAAPPVGANEPIRQELKSLRDDVLKSLADSRANFAANNTNDFNMRYPGFSYQFLAKLGPAIPDRENFIFDVGQREESDRASLFIDGQENLCFRIIAKDSDQVIVKVPPGLQTFGFDAVVFVICEYGRDKDFSFVRLLINGREVAKKRQVPPIEFHANGARAVIGADLTGRNGGVVSFAEIIGYSKTMDVNNVNDLIGYMDRRAKTNHSWIVFSGQQWLANDKLKWSD